MSGLIQDNQNYDLGENNMKLGNNEKKSSSVEIKKSLKSGKKWLAVTMFSLTGSILLMGASTVSVNAETVPGDTTTNQPANDSSEGESTFTYDETRQTLTISAGKLPQSTTISYRYPHVKKIVFTGPTTALEKMNYYFSGLNSLESIEGLNYLNTSNVTNMASMFSDDGNLKNVDVSSFNTEHVNRFVKMFSGTGLESLDISGFDFRNAIIDAGLTDMFSDSNKILSLTLNQNSNIIHSNLKYSNLIPKNPSLGYDVDSSANGWRQKDGSDEVISTKDLLEKYDGTGEKAPEGKVTWVVNAVPTIKFSINYKDYNTGKTIVQSDSSKALQGPEDLKYTFSRMPNLRWNETEILGYNLDEVYLEDEERPLEDESSETGPSVQLPKYVDTDNGNYVLTLRVKRLENAIEPLGVNLNLPNGHSVHFDVSMYAGDDQDEYNSKKNGKDWEELQRFSEVDNEINPNSKVTILKSGAPNFKGTLAEAFEIDKAISLKDFRNIILSYNKEQYSTMELNFELNYDKVTIPDENNNGGNTGGGNHNNGNHNNGGNSNNNNDNNNDNNEDKTPGETVVADKKQTLGTFANGSVVKLYDNNGKEVTSHALAQNTAWQSDKTMTLNDELYYRVSSTEWVKASDVYTYTAHQSRVKVRPNTIAKLVTADNKPVSRGLMESSGWITDLYIMINNEKYYRVSTNEFVSAADVGEY